MLLAGYSWPSLISYGSFAAFPIIAITVNKIYLNDKLKSLFKK
jgi:hypothetical protein